jgi:hypothetical protein
MPISLPQNLMLICSLSYWTPFFSFFTDVLNGSKSNRPFGTLKNTKESRSASLPSGYCDPGSGEWAMDKVA